MADPKVSFIRRFHCKTKHCSLYVHQWQIKMMLIKGCDVSNEVRPMEVSEPWVDCLLQEYFRQSDLEKAKGLPVQPFMDREKVTKATAQISFIKFVLIPMFQLLSEVQLDFHSSFNTAYCTLYNVYCIHSVYCIVYTYCILYSV